MLESNFVDLGKQNFYGCAWSSLLCMGFLYLQSTGSRRVGLSTSWCTGLFAPRYVEYFQTRDQTCVPCTGKQILNCWTAGKSLDCDVICHFV